MKTIKNLRDNYACGGYGSSMSFDQYVRENTPKQPRSYSEMREIQKNYEYGGYGSSMSFDTYYNKYID